MSAGVPKTSTIDKPIFYDFQGHRRFYMARVTYTKRILLCCQAGNRRRDYVRLFFVFFLAENLRQVFHHVVVDQPNVAHCICIQLPQRGAGLAPVRHD